MKNKKQKIESNADIFLSEFNRLMTVFLTKDTNKVSSLKDELYRKAEMYKQEYKPWSEKITVFNEHAKAYFAENKAVKNSRYSNLFVKEINSITKALYAVIFVMLSFDLVYTITVGQSHSGPDLILIFFWIVFLARLIFNFWLEPSFIFKRKNKWPKGVDITKSTRAFNLYDAYSNASMAAFFMLSHIKYSQLLEALSVLEDSYPKAYRALNLKLKEIKDKGKFN